MKDNIQSGIIRKKTKYIAFGIIAIVLIFLGIAFSINMGSMKISLEDTRKIILNELFNFNYTVGDNLTAIVWKIRMPRIICGVFVGAGLAVSGVIFQGILQNPLADPYTIGISTGASFGASLAIVLNLLYGVYFPTVIAALIGAFVTLILVIMIAKRGNGLEGSNIIIGGIIIGSILSSAVSFLKMVAGENVSAIVFWIMGSLSAKNWNDVYLVCPIVLIGIALAFFLSRQLDIMALGDDNAKALGINTDRLRLLYLIIGSVMTAVCVCTCGVIGFVGLIVPHLLRLSLTAENRVLIPLSALLGGLLLLLADSITRILTAGEIPVGVLTTLIGGPFFIFVFTRKGGYKNG